MKGQKTYKPHYKPGQIVPVFMQFQTNENYIGEAKLLSFVSDGLSFYESSNSKSPNDVINIYSSEVWVVEFTESSYFPKGFQKKLAIRFLLYSGTDKSHISKYTNYKSQLDLQEDEQSEND